MFFLLWFVVYFVNSYDYLFKLYICKIFKIIIEIVEYVMRYFSDVYMYIKFN